MQDTNLNLSIYNTHKIIYYTHIQSIHAIDTARIKSSRLSGGSAASRHKGGCMTKEEKLNKVCDNFSSLPEDKQDYILGILQALVFANTTSGAGQETSQAENAPR